MLRCTWWLQKPKLPCRISNQFFLVGEQLCATFIGPSSMCIKKLFLLAPQNWVNSSGCQGGRCLLIRMMACGSETSLSCREDLTLFAILIRWLCNVLPTQCPPYVSLVSQIRKLPETSWFPWSLWGRNEILLVVPKLDKFDTEQRWLDSKWIITGRKKILGIWFNLAFFSVNYLCMAKWIVFLACSHILLCKFCVQIVISFVIEGKMSPSTKTLLT